MMLIKVCRIMRLLGVSLVCALLVHSAAAQAQDKRGSIRSAEALLRNLKSAGLTPIGIRIEPVQPNDIATSLSNNRHALMSPPPAYIGSAMTDVRLPASAPKRFSLPGVSKDHFFAHTRIRPTDWQHLDLPRVDASELQKARRPSVVVPE